MKPKRLLVIAAGILQLPVIQKARELGYYVIAADGNKDAIGMKHANESVCIDITSKKKMLELAISKQIDGVIHPCSEVSMEVMGLINDQMGLAGISEETARRATNKHLMREAFEQYGAPTPKSYCTYDGTSAWKLFNDEFLTTAILKPSRNSGSRGIAKIDKSIKQDEFISLYDRAYSESRDKSVLIEEFVDGPEFSVEIIVWNHQVYVLAVTDKKTTGAPYFVELGHNQPSVYAIDVVDGIKKAAIKGVEALGLDNCAAHAELKWQDGRAYIIEIGARLGGDFISTELVHLSTGIDMVAAAIEVAMGDIVRLDKQEESHGVCIRYFTPKPGKLIDIKGDELLNDKHIYYSEIYPHIGDTINEVKSSLDRSGHVIVVDDNVQDAIMRAERIVNGVSLITE